MLLLALAARPLAAEPLHSRIDAAVAATAIGPLSPRCDDADFVRRLYLDLTGVIPTAEQVQAFLDDPEPDKRARLIDTLIDSPEFSRHFASQLDVMLLDRRSDSSVAQSQWESYLIESLVRRKPLDQLFAELIYPEAIGDQPHPARKFLVGSKAEPHSMTRDVGRIVFGMDLQCAQCHDHPLIADYLQEDYYGLFAFLSRTSLFEDKANKVTTLSEKADGQVGFESVFTGDGREITRPRLPKGASVYHEPEVDQQDAYLVEPDKTNAGRPKHSRRRLLSERLVEDRLFRRNLANRIWMLLMGRGLVHPIDFHHGDNPSSHPQLLAMLADELADGDFALRPLVRQLVLSQTYQRSCQPPSPQTVNFSDVAARREALQGQREAVADELQQLRSLATEARKTWRQAVQATDEVDAELPKLDAALAEAKQRLEEANEQHQQAEAELQQTVARSESLQAVLAAAAEASERFDDEPALAESQALLKQRAGELTEQVGKLRSQVDEHAKLVRASRQQRQQAEEAQQALLAQRVDPPTLIELEQAHLLAAAARSDGEARLQMVDDQIELADQIVRYRQLADEDPDAAAASWEAIVAQWTARGQVAPLKPLSPEQLAASTLQAIGMLASREAAARSKVDKEPPKQLEAEEIDEDEKAILLEIALHAQWLNQLRGNINQFVAQFGGRFGDEFQATVNQALFLGNGPLHGWLDSAALISQLKDVEATGPLADQLALAVLSRPATAAEQRQLAAVLQPDEGDAEDDQKAALADLVWAMLASNEFRFNH